MKNCAVITIDDRFATLDMPKFKITQTLQRNKERDIEMLKTCAIENGAEEIDIIVHGKTFETWTRQNVKKIKAMWSL